MILHTKSLVIFTGVVVRSSEMSKPRKGRRQREMDRAAWALLKQGKSLMVRVNLQEQYSVPKPKPSAFAANVRPKHRTILSDPARFAGVGWTLARGGQARVGRNTMKPADTTPFSNDMVSAPRRMQHLKETPHKARDKRVAKIMASIAGKTTIKGTIRPRSEPMPDMTPTSRLLKKGE